MQRMELVIEIGPRAGAGKSRPKSNASAFDASKQDVDDPDPKHISTSYTERANLTMRMSMRRFTRLTNAFSKKLENHAHMVALYALWYNFVRAAGNASDGCRDRKAAMVDGGRGCVGRCPSGESRRQHISWLNLDGREPRRRTGVASVLYWAAQGGVALRQGTRNNRNSQRADRRGGSAT